MLNQQFLWFLPHVGYSNKKVALESASKGQAAGSKSSPAELSAAGVCNPKSRYYCVKKKLWYKLCYVFCFAAQQYLFPRMTSRKSLLALQEEASKLLKCFHNFNAFYFCREVLLDIL